jgi:DNA modification methylase
MKIEMYAPDALTVAVNNSRTHAPDQVQQIADSMREFGFTNPLLVDETGKIIAGHGRLQAAKLIGLDEVPCVVLAGLTETQRRAYLIADNQLPLNAGWNLDVLKLEVQDILADGFDLGLLGFADGFLEGLLDDIDPEGLTDVETVPDESKTPVTRRGDIWNLGPHRVMCGDSTEIDAVEALANGERAQLLHADPPYGMGKQKDGVENDNLYRDKLDAFQMEWWTTFRTFLTDTASAYIWGNAPDLWRLWYVGGLADSEGLELRNQIVWDKKSIPGKRAPALNQYPEATEHMLFFQIGAQFVGNVNTVDFPTEWAPVLDYLAGQAKAAGLTPKRVTEICGVGMYSHWFSASQFSLIPEKHYHTLAANTGIFARPWSDIKAEWDRVKGIPVATQVRSYFDNTHDSMHDVWEFSRVVGAERHGHATPKPVDMMQRVMRSSLEKGGLCLEPFGGTGSTLMAAEKTGRRCYTMELTPSYCDVIVRRWQDFTGKDATLESTGERFDSVA